MQSLTEIEQAASRFKTEQQHVKGLQAVQASKPHNNSQPLDNSNIILQHQIFLPAPKTLIVDRDASAMPDSAAKSNSLTDPDSASDRDSAADRPCAIQQQRSLPVPKFSCIHSIPTCTSLHVTQQPNSISHPAEAILDRTNPSTNSTLHTSNYKACGSIPDPDVSGQSTHTYSNVHEFHHASQYTHVFQNSLAMQASDCMQASEGMQAAEFRSSSQQATDTSTIKQDAKTDEIFALRKHNPTTNSASRSVENVSGDGERFSRPSHEGAEGSFSLTKKLTRIKRPPVVDDNCISETQIDAKTLASESELPVAWAKANLLGLHKGWKDYRSLLWREYLGMVSRIDTSEMCTCDQQ